MDYKDHDIFRQRRRLRIAPKHWLASGCGAAILAGLAAFAASEDSHHAATSSDRKRVSIPVSEVEHAAKPGLGTATLDAARAVVTAPGGAVDLSVAGSAFGTNPVSPDAATLNGATLNELQASAPDQQPGASDSILLAALEPGVLPGAALVGTGAEAAAVANESPVYTHSRRIDTGDSLYKILAGWGISPQGIAALLRTDGEFNRIRRLQPGRTLRARIEDGALETLVYQLNPAQLIEVARVPDSDRFEAKWVDAPVEYRTKSVRGEIKSSFYVAALEAGLPDNLTMELAKILGWDVDFAIDTRRGDRFQVLYEEAWFEGQRLDKNRILAARYVGSRGEVEVLRFAHEDGEVGYYTPKGVSIRQAFTRNPLPVSTITSRFNPNRLHPIFKTRRPHRGVDYGAPRGTPVRATGNGRVIFAGRKGGYGNAVILQHGDTYKTLYAHLHRFRKGLGNGQSVKQGDTIGYVGATGWATGPHLHYEFQVNGQHVDPLKVKLPTGLPIAKAEMARFESHKARVLAALDGDTGLRVAQAADADNSATP